MKHTSVLHYGTHCMMRQLFIKVLKGSHKCGRIEHKQVGGQMGADTERVEQIRKVSRR